MTTMSMSIQSLAGNADEFPILGTWNFLNHAAVSPLPRRAAAAVVKYARQAMEHAYIDAKWYEQVEVLRAVAGQLINADRKEIAFVKNTSEGLAQVAHAIDWKEGDRIVTTAVEYPANAYPWMDVAKRFGVEVVRMEEVADARGVRRVPLEKILEAAKYSRTRLVTLSHVEYGSGQRHDLVAIGEFCREREIRFCVDGIQSVGALPVDVRAMNIDYLSADGHKWMLGPEGAGIFYCRRELIPQTHPVLVGWMNVKKAMDFDRIDFDLRDDSGRFECGSHAIPGLMGLKASLELLAGVGTQAIWRRIRELSDRLAERLNDQGFVVVSPRGQEESSGIVSFTREGLDAAAVAKRLHQKRIEIAVRAGRLRCSPHFYNTPEQMDQLVAAVSERT